MKIEIFNREAIEVANITEKHVLISVHSPHATPINLPTLQSRIKTLYLEFHDIDNEVRGNKYSYTRDNGCFECNREEIKFALFCPEQAGQILDFVEKYKDEVELICINCEAGISRSSAIGASLSHIYNGVKTDQRFFDHYLPNRRVYSTILNHYYSKFL